MRILPYAIALAATSISLGSTAWAQDASMQTPAFTGHQGTEVAGEPFDVKVASLHSEAKKLAKADGGNLSPAHVELLQTKFATINRDEYLRRKGK